MQRGDPLVGAPRERRPASAARDVGVRRRRRRRRRRAPAGARVRDAASSSRRVERHERRAAPHAIAARARGPSAIGAMIRLAIVAVVRARTTPPASNARGRSACDSRDRADTVTGGASAFAGGAASRRPRARRQRPMGSERRSASHQPHFMEYARARG